MSSDVAALTERPRAVLARPVLMCATAAVLVAGSAVALAGPPSALEGDLTVWFNDTPGWLARVLWPIMQFGTLWCPVVVGIAAAVAWRSRRGAARLVAGVLLSGVGAWFAAKLLKDLVERGRPLAYLPGIDVREGSGAGLGFPSGHTAVAFAVAVAVLPALPRWGRTAVLAGACVVGVARVVYGMHLWLDVIGGAALGVLVAAAVQLVGLGVQRYSARVSHVKLSQPGRIGNQKVASR